MVLKHIMVTRTIACIQHNFSDYKPFILRLPKSGGDSTRLSITTNGIILLCFSYKKS
jgi:hypothetical protein